MIDYRYWICSFAIFLLTGPPTPLQLSRVSDFSPKDDAYLKQSELSMIKLQ